MKSIINELYGELYNLELNIKMIKFKLNDLEAKLSEDKKNNNNSETFFCIRCGEYHDVCRDGIDSIEFQKGIDAFKEDLFLNKDIDYFGFKTKSKSFIKGYEFLERVVGID